MTTTSASKQQQQRGENTAVLKKNNNSNKESEEMLIESTPIKNQSVLLTDFPKRNQKYVFMVVNLVEWMDYMPNCPKTIHTVLGFYVFSKSEWTGPKAYKFLKHPDKFNPKPPRGIISCCLLCLGTPKFWRARKSLNPNLIWSDVLNLYLSRTVS